jgi:gelsolin
MHGGISTGFHHVSSLPPPDEHRLYRINLSGRSNLVVHQVLAVKESLIEGDVFVLDKGTKIWQFNTKESVGKEKFKAAEFVQSLMADRESQAEVTVFGPYR